VFNNELMIIFYGLDYVFMFIQNYLITNFTILRYVICFRRFSEHFAKSANSLKCVDFVPTFLEKNRAVNGKSANIAFLEADVRKFDVDPEKLVNSLKIYFS